VRPIRAFRLASLAAAAAVLAAAGACGRDPNSPAAWSSDLAAAQVRWRVAGATDYTFRLTRSCFCGNEATRPVTITVRDGLPAGIVYADFPGGSPDTTLFRQFLTMERYFSYLADVVANEPASFAARFDASLGYPIFVSVDPLAQAADEEFSVQIDLFVRGWP